MRALGLLLLPLLLLLASASSLPLSSPPPSAPLLAIVAKSLDTYTKFNLVGMSPSGAYSQITNLSTVGAFVSCEAAWMADKNVLAIAGLGIKLETALTFVTSAGQVLGHYEYDWGIITALEYDVNTKQLFALATLNSDAMVHLLLFQLDGTFTDLLKLPQNINIGVTTYCPNGHIFFATYATKTASKNGLLRIDTQAKKVASMLPLNDTIDALFWDYTAATMYAFAEDSMDAGILTTIDLTTGNRASTIASFPYYSASIDAGGACALDLASKMLYCSLIDMSNEHNPAYWVTINAKTGQSSKPSLLQGYPIDLSVVS